MSDHSHDLAPQAEQFDPKSAGALPTYCLVAGVVGIVGSLIGLFVAREQFAYSWLFGFSYFFTIAVGALFWTCLHHATDAEWSVVVRRQLENVGRLLPVFLTQLSPIRLVLLMLCMAGMWINGKNLHILKCFV